MIDERSSDIEGLGCGASPMMFLHCSPIDFVSLKDTHIRLLLLHYNDACVLLTTPFYLGANGQTLGSIEMVGMIVLPARRWAR